MRKLRGFLGDPLPEEEARLWAEMSLGQRASALQRMAALKLWNLGKAPRDANIAAWNAGLKSVSRFYEMAAAFEEKPSLTTVGVLATAPRKRKNRHEDLLSEGAARLIDEHPQDSVRKLALKLGEIELPPSAAAEESKTPSYNTLRRFIEDELRRRSQKDRPGKYVGFDCCACSMQRMDGSEYALFAIVDKETQLILGAALGNAHGSRRGYAEAASSALDRLKRPPLAGLAWVDNPAGFQLVVGVDAENWERVRSEVRDAGVRVPIEPATRPRRFGRYVRAAAGPRLGRIALTPMRTEAAAEASSVEPTRDDVVRLWIEVDAHNEPRLHGLDREPASQPPDDLLRMLRYIADGHPGPK